MNYGYNMVILCGILADYPDFRFSKKGNPFARLDLIVPNPLKIGETILVRVMCYNDIAFNVGSYKDKGDLVLVEGQLATQVQRIGNQELVKHAVIARRVVFMPSIPTTKVKTTNKPTISAKEFEDANLKKENYEKEIKKQNENIDKIKSSMKTDAEETSRDIKTKNNYYGKISSESTSKKDKKSDKDKDGDKDSDENDSDMSVHAEDPYEEGYYKYWKY